jgi:hypothetical protein
MTKVEGAYKRLLLVRETSVIYCEDRMVHLGPNTLRGQDLAPLNASVKPACKKSLLHNRCNVNCALQIIPTFISNSYLRVEDEYLFSRCGVSMKICLEI